ncbi:hypothetical protein NIES2098_39580 [Calothrix sp. NIES-2098]|nr:hypothetical protein NIES2098_39580 [Calothrix sp. NIES-2098]
MLIYTLIVRNDLSTNQHLKQQGTIILPVFNLNLELNPPKFQSLTRSYALTSEV